MSPTSLTAFKSSMSAGEGSRRGITRRPSLIHLDKHLGGKLHKDVRRRNPFTALVESHWFEAIFAGLIVANALVMAADVQYVGVQVGHDLNYPGAYSPAAEGARVFDLIGWIFGIVFLLEIVLKVLGLGHTFFMDHWNWIDSTIVLLWIFGKIGATLLPVNTQLLRIVRLTRLARMFRLVRKISAFDQLYLMTTAIRGSVASLVWSIALLFILQMMFALLLNQLLCEAYLRDDAHSLEDRRAVYTYYGTFTRAMFSMFELCLANYPPICRVLSENVSEWFMLVAVVYKLSIGFALIGVINGVFMQETFKVYSNDDGVMMRTKERTSAFHRMKMKMLFDAADEDESGTIDLQEFKAMINDPAVKLWLSAMDLDTRDAEYLFNLCDEDGSGELDIDELIGGAARLKGAARSIDVRTLLREVQELKSLIARG